MIHSCGYIELSVQIVACNNWVGGILVAVMTLWAHVSGIRSTRGGSQGCTSDHGFIEGPGLSAV